MSDILNIGLVSHSSSTLNKLEAVFEREPGVLANRILLREEDLYPQQTDIENYQVVVMALGDSAERMLSAVSSSSNAAAPAIVFTGPSESAELIRLAFKAGAQDYISEPIDKEALVQAVKLAATSKHLGSDEESSDITLLVTPKGGAGATTLAINLASILAARSNNPSVLVTDLDIQYGNLPLSYDEIPNSRLTSALIHGEQIDASILEACICRKSENPQVLATYSDQLISPWDIDPLQINALFSLISHRYDHVVIDLPRSIDPVTFHALERASRVCVLVQQTLTDMRCASQYIRLLQDQGIASESICIVINRHEKKNVIREQDFVSAFAGHEVFCVSNDFKRVNYCSDNTIPLIERWRSAPITKSMLDLAEQLWPTGESTRRWTFPGQKDTRKTA